MKRIVQFCLVSLISAAGQVSALSLAPEEFDASRKMACMLAQQTLGRLSDDEYGAKAHSLLDRFEENERDNILAQAVGYYGGVMFSRNEQDERETTLRLEDFVTSSTCVDGYQNVTLRL
jgi:hypothetical protein